VVNRVDGATLRELRRRAGVGLRQVAGGSRVRVSDGHLSRVERGLRPVTPAVVAAYEKALGVRVGATGPGRRADPFDRTARQAFLTTVATVAVGGPPGDPVDRLLATGGEDAAALPPPVGAGAAALPPLGGADVAHVEQAALMVAALDLRYGGGLAWQMAGGLLRWAVGLRRGATGGAVRARLDAAIGAMAGRAGWAAFDAGRHDAARALFTLALDSAVQAQEVDLRAHILADIGAHYNYLGSPDECLTVVRLGDGDERVAPAVRQILHGVKAQAYAAKQDPPACARHIDLAEAAAAAVRPDEVPAWMGELVPAHTRAVTGHAAAVLACASGSDADLADAQKRLMQAVDGLATTGRVRALALCQTRLALVHLRGGDREQAAGWARQALSVSVELRSARLWRALAGVRAGAAAQPDDADLRELVDQIETASRSSM
jgi:transcriptional regulator with XRE-family HTH domain